MFSFLELLARKEILPVLILPFELFVGALHSSFCLGQLSAFLLENVNFLALFLSTSNRTFPVLETFSGFFVLLRIVLEIENT